MHAYKFNQWTQPIGMGGHVLGVGAAGRSQREKKETYVTL